MTLKALDNLSKIVFFSATGPQTIRSTIFSNPTRPFPDQSDINALSEHPNSPNLIESDSSLFNKNSFFSDREGRRCKYNNGRYRRVLLRE